MPILIPSKNIYEINNSKIRDNLIDNVTISTTVVTTQNDYGVAVFDKEYFSGIDFIPIPQETKNQNFVEREFRSEISTGVYAYTYGASYVAYNNQQVFEQDIYVPIAQNNKYINSLLNSESEDEESIKYTLTGYILTGSASSLREELKNDFPKITYGSVESRSERVAIQIPLSLSEEVTIGNFVPIVVSAEVDLNDLSNIKNTYAKFAIKDGIEHFKIHIRILCNVTTVSLNSRYDWLSYSPPSAIKLSGKYTKYIAEELKISIYGDTIGINLNDGSISYNKDGKKPFSLNGNELLQDSATTDGNITTEHLANNILNQYKNGKETATILCDISDYYDYDVRHQKRISIQNDSLPMAFKNHDEVIPMVYNPQGNDLPMSLYNDGTPKIFEVISTDIFYDGAVWQELQLLEK